MGALHQGHISLIGRAKQECGLCVSSIFVNPTQFNDKKDFDKYPSTIEADIDGLEKAGCDLLFLPGQEEIYPAGTAELPHYELGYLETVLEGKFRPGHFQGVCQVVDRLLQIVQPGYLYLGQKDYQQCMVIKKLVEITGSSIRIVICPTLREPDGLAMSSRNMRLNEEERKQAVKIFETLSLVKNEIKAGKLQAIKQKATDHLTAAGFKVDYIDIADAATLALMDEWDGKKKLVVLAAAFLNDVRLIDNMILEA
jgi:pantoate--beta-alanine ligase